MLDLLIVVLIGLAGYAGFRMGFISRVTSWAGLLLGLFIGVALTGPALDSLGRGASTVQVVLVGFGLPIGLAGLGLALGLLVASQVSFEPESDGMQAADSAGGAIVGVLGVLVVVWLLAPALADKPGATARVVRSSLIAGALSDGLPDSPRSTQAIRGLLGDGSPQVLGSMDSSPDIGPVPASASVSSEVVAMVTPSILKVVNRGCGVETGTGWVAGEGVVVTNAHVVAGADRLELVAQDGRTVTGVVTAIDPVADVAIVRTTGLNAPALTVVDSEVGQSGSVFGHPGGRALEQAPFEIRRRLTAMGRDIYSNAAAERDLLVVAADLEPGNSGSPLVDGEGRVVAMTFAISPDRPGVAFAVPTAEVVRVLESAGSGTVDSGPCTR